MRTLRYSIVTGTFACGAIFASFYACKSTQPLGESSIQSTAAVPISGDEYETDPIYADKVVPVGSIKDSVLPSSYNESNLFSDKIDQRVDLRLDTAEYVKKLEDEGKFKKGDFTSSLGFSRLAYSKALTSIGRKPENFAAASVLAAMRRMRRACVISVLRSP